MIRKLVYLKYYWLNCFDNVKYISRVIYKKFAVEEKELLNKVIIIIVHYTFDKNKSNNKFEQDSELSPHFLSADLSSFTHFPLIKLW